MAPRAMDGQIPRTQTQQAGGRAFRGAVLLHCCAPFAFSWLWRGSGAADRGVQGPGLRLRGAGLRRLPDGRPRAHPALGPAGPPPGGALAPAGVGRRHAGLHPRGPGRVRGVPPGARTGSTCQRNPRPSSTLRQRVLSPASSRSGASSLPSPASASPWMRSWRKRKLRVRCLLLTAPSWAKLGRRVLQRLVR